MEFTDWRYRLVYGMDWLVHKVIGRRELPLLCNLERAMYWWRKAVPTTCGICGRDYRDNTGSSICPPCLHEALTI